MRRKNHRPPACEAGLGLFARRQPVRVGCLEVEHEGDVGALVGAHTARVLVVPASKPSDDCGRSNIGELRGLRELTAASNRIGCDLRGCRVPPRPGSYVYAFCPASTATSPARALFTVSSYSLSGSLASTMPAPAWSHISSLCATMVRMAMATSMLPSKPM